MDDGIRASADESNTEPGVSVTEDKSYAQEYTEDSNTGRVYAVRLHVKNPVLWGDPSLGWDGGNVGEFYRLAREAGYDAVVHPNEVRVFDPSVILIDIESTLE
jgi:hypothetical protein